jgi:hypothetical protein
MIGEGLEDAGPEGLAPMEPLDSAARYYYLLPVHLKSLHPHF